MAPTARVGRDEDASRRRLALLVEREHRLAAPPTGDWAIQSAGPPPPVPTQEWEDGEDDEGLVWLEPDDPASALRAAASAPASAPAGPGVAQRARQFAREHVAVLLVVLAVGVSFAVVQATRSRAEVISPPVVTESPGHPASTTASPSAPTSPTMIKVHVLGAVVSPGVVTLPAGARVIDAVNAAGGLAEAADPAQLNLAAVLADGCQIIIGTASHPLGEVNGADDVAGSGGEPGSATINLNTASQAQLESLPGVGPVTAGKILAWREQHQRFSRIEELQEIDGIGPKTYAQIAPYVSV